MECPDQIESAALLRRDIDARAALAKEDKDVVTSIHRGFLPEPLAVAVHHAIDLFASSLH
ncbi:MAG: hypothetical protein QM778_18410 [Myxococcales bacterium]